MSESGHIFISYRSIEADFALKLAADLKNAGVSVWMDKLDTGIKVGDDWVQALQDGLDHCSAVIAILSPDYVESKYCRRELKRADMLGRSIYPVLLRKLDETQWPFEIQEKQYLDFRDWHDKSVYEKKFDELLKFLPSAQKGIIPDKETQYLTSLIAELEGRKGVLEYVELAAETDSLAEVRPKPIEDDEWGFALLIEEKSITSISSKSQKRPLKSIAEAIDLYPRFVLIGEPGSGKTTTLRRLALDAAHRRLENPYTAPIPLLLYLPQWRIESAPIDFVLSEWPLGDNLVDMLRSGDIILYLDGLNEIGTTSVEKVAKLSDWLHSTDAPAKVIVTCRAGDYDVLRLGNLPMIVTQDLDDSQIRQFAMKYLENHATSFLKVVLPEDLPEWEKSRTLSQLARNPYMLAALAYVYENTQERTLPQNTGALFQRLVKALWQREHQRSTLGWLPFEQVQIHFARLAFAMIYENQPADVSFKYVADHLGSEDWIRLGISASFLTVKDDHVRFYHQLMQEYFAATELENMVLDFDFRIRDMVVQEQMYDRWAQVVFALLGITNKPKNIELVLKEKHSYLALICVINNIYPFSDVSGEFIYELLEDHFHKYRTIEDTLIKIEEGSWFSEAVLSHMSALEISKDAIENNIDKAISKIGFHIIQPLKNALRTGLTYIRQKNAADVLTRIGTPEALEAVEEWRRNQPES